MAPAASTALRPVGQSKCLLVRPGQDEVDPMPLDEIHDCIEVARRVALGHDGKGIGEVPTGGIRPAVDRRDPDVVTLARLHEANIERREGPAGRGHQDPKGHWLRSRASAVSPARRATGCRTGRPTTSSRRLAGKADCPAGMRISKTSPSVRTLATPQITGRRQSPVTALAQWDLGLDPAPSRRARASLRPSGCLGPCGRSRRLRARSRGRRRPPIGRG